MLTADIFHDPQGCLLTPGLHKVKGRERRTTASSSLRHRTILAVNDLFLHACDFRKQDDLGRHTSSATLKRGFIEILAE